MAAQWPNAPRGASVKPTPRHSVGQVAGSHFSVEAVARLPFFRLVIRLSKKYCNLPAAHCASCARHKMRPNVDWIPVSGRVSADTVRAPDSTVEAWPLG